MTGIARSLARMGAKVSPHKGMIIDSDRLPVRCRSWMGEGEAERLWGLADATATVRIPASEAPLFATQELALFVPESAATLVSSLDQAMGTSTKSKREDHQRHVSREKLQSSTPSGHQR